MDEGDEECLRRTVPQWLTILTKALAAIVSSILWRDREREGGREGERKQKLEAAHGKLV